MSRRIVLHTGNPEETRAVGRAIARSFPGGVTVSLEGPLGAGKTVLVTGVCQALGVTAPVTSPTYTLHHEYEARDGRRVLHVDCFRLTGPAELEDLGLADRIEDDTVTLVEWGDRALAALPAQTVRILMAPDGDEGRRVEIRIPESAGDVALGLGEAS